MGLLHMMSVTKGVRAEFFLKAEDAGTKVLANLVVVGAKFGC